ncbi:MAG: isoprenylcysteine carboxylmethyltransferase family protein [Candidatus Acidiferrum sp.]|jgi:protein-S-isoprenylcysteine O-methyltransferase Ste14
MVAQTPKMSVHPPNDSAARWINASWSLVRVLLAVSLVFWCALHLRSLDRHFGFGLPHWGRIPGLLMIAVGGGLVLWCGSILANVGIFESPGSRMLPREFVVIGPFRYIRNPMSLGATALFAGFGLWLGSISILLFSAILFLIFHFVAVQIEEPGLEKRFGNKYVEYKQTVGRWIPKVGTLERFKD